MNVAKGTKGFLRIGLSERFWSKVEIRSQTECWPWLGADDGTGRGTIWLDKRLHKAPRVAWMLVHGEPIPAHLHACHSCDNPNCVNPAHIWLGTHQENHQDCADKGRGGMFTKPETRSIGKRNGAHTKPERRRRGETHGLTTLTEQQVREIRAAAGTVTQRTLAMMFEVSRNTIYNIISRRTWGHVE